MGELQAALTLYGHLPRKNIICCTILIFVYVQKGYLGNAIKIFAEMTQGGNVANWNAMITALTQLKIAGFRPDKGTLICLIQF